MRIRKVSWLLLMDLFLVAVLLSVQSVQVAAGLDRADAATCLQLVQNGGFESGRLGWQQTSAQGFELISDFNPHAGGLGAYLGGVNNADDRLGQAVTLPASASLTLTAWRFLATAETAGSFDTLTIALLRPDGTMLATLITLDNTAPAGIWEELTFDLSPYAGQSTVLQFAARTDQQNISDFYLDDINLWACEPDATSTPTPTVTPVTATPSATAVMPARLVYLPLILK